MVVQCAGVQCDFLAFSPGRLWRRLLGEVASELPIPQTEGKGEIGVHHVIM